jgi:hypothetical protein
MGIFGTIKDKVSGLFEGHGDKIGESLDKAGTVIDEKTGGRFGDQIDGGVQKAKDGLDGLDDSIR